MTMVVRLDTLALNALFPEGSDARVELQNAVIANFADKLARKLTASAVSNLEKQIKAAIDSELRTLGVTRSGGWIGGGTVELSTDIKERLRKEAKAKFDETCNEALQEQVKTINKSIVENGKKIAEVVDNAVKNGLDKKVEGLVKDSLKKAIGA